jgi:hypothetical protein
MITIETAAAMTMTLTPTDLHKRAEHVGEDGEEGGPEAARPQGVVLHRADDRRPHLPLLVQRLMKERSSARGVSSFFSSLRVVWRDAEYVEPGTFPPNKGRERAGQGD